MKEIKYTVKDKSGLHVRPIAEILDILSENNCRALICKGDNKGKAVDINNPVSVLALEIVCGDSFFMTIYGEKEEEAVVAIYNYLQNNL